MTVDGGKKNCETIVFFFFFFLILPSDICRVEGVVERVNEPDSFKSISRPRPIGYQAAPIPAPFFSLAPNLLASLSLCSPSSLTCFLMKNAIGRTDSGRSQVSLHAVGVFFFFPGKGGQRWTLRNWEAMSWGSAWLSQRWGKSRKWLVTAAPRSPSCDAPLNTWSLPSGAGAMWHLSTAHRRFVRS